MATAFGTNDTNVMVDTATAIISHCSLESPLSPSFGASVNR
jgi:hypothetical protein